MKNVMLIGALLASSALCAQNSTDWNTNYFVDEFGDETGQSYKSYLTDSGNFSNSATSRSELTAVVIFKEDGDRYMKFKLYEYGRGAEESLTYSSAEYGFITMKDENGVKYGVPAQAYKEGGLYIWDNTISGESKSMIKYLREQGFVVYDSGKEFLDFITSTNMIFTVLVESSQFSEYGSSKYVFKFPGLNTNTETVVSN